MKTNAKLGYDGLFTQTIDEITTPEDGDMVFKDRWWQVTENNEVLFYKDFSAPQCNSYKEVAERIAAKFGRKVVFIPLAFVPVEWNKLY